MASKPRASSHSCIVLKNQLGKGRGELVQWRQAQGDYCTHSHSNSRPSRRSPPPRKGLVKTILDSDLASLTEKECLILDAIDSSDSRYTVYSTPGKLEWGVGLKVGDTVLARLPDSEDGGKKYATAMVMSIGQLEWMHGKRHFFGVEITVCEEAG